MKNWHKYGNYRLYKNADDSTVFIITVDGEDVEVGEEIYREYASLARKMKYMELDLKRDRVLQNKDGMSVKDENGLPVLLPEHETSLDRLIEEDWDFISSSPSPEEHFFAAGDSEPAKLRRCIALLTDDEQSLIKALFFGGLTEKAYAEILGVKQQSVNERKQRILKKIKNIWGKPC